MTSAVPPSVGRGPRSKCYPLTLVDLEAFVVAARTGDVAATGAVLGLANQAVLRRLRKLEQRVGAELFPRLPESTELSPTGQRMLPLATAAHERLAALESFVADERAARPPGRRAAS